MLIFSFRHVFHFVHDSIVQIVLLLALHIIFYSFNHLQDAAPYLQKGSSVVIISSIAGYTPSAAMGMYGVTKTALLGLTKVLNFGIIGI